MSSAAASGAAERTLVGVSIDTTDGTTEMGKVTCQHLPDLDEYSGPVLHDFDHLFVVRFGKVDWLSGPGANLHRLREEIGLFDTSLLGDNASPSRSICRDWRNILCSLW